MKYLNIAKLKDKIDEVSRKITKVDLMSEISQQEKDKITADWRAEFHTLRDILDCFEEK